MLSSPLPTRKRIRFTIHGIVQGVGFRPFIYRLAQRLKLGGWVANTARGVVIEVEGETAALQLFHTQMTTQPPPGSKIQHMTSTMIPEKAEGSFTIQESESRGTPDWVMPPDLATCQACLQEINDPRSRRYRYPFTTCTHCGPRYSIACALPYDRDTTTMRTFTMCSACQTEYENMYDRRFHAETIACPACGPSVHLWNAKGEILADTEEALQQACQLIWQGGILAVKGLGGFQLWVNALSEKAVNRLRRKKHRPRKPFAVLFPALDRLKSYAFVSQDEERLLSSLEAPIVLVRKSDASALAPAVAPNNPYIGAMIPYTPLHHLLAADLDIPVIATSGNLSEETIVIDEQEALIRLNGIADAFLIHHRPIARPVDDSVVRLVDGQILILRRARGYAPTLIPIEQPIQEEQRRPVIVALGGHLKSTVAISTDHHVVMSQHIGNLSTVESLEQLEKTVRDHLQLMDRQPDAIACDGHPDYASTRFAVNLGKTLDIPVIHVQHHHAHIQSCMAEHGLRGPVCGVAWDGTGYGTDGGIWGGECLLMTDSGCTRVAHLHPFPLPGGEQAMREPCRVALSLLYGALGKDLMSCDLPPLTALGADTMGALLSMIRQRYHSPLTTSMGRLFDGVSSLLGIMHYTSFEGEAAMALEYVSEEAKDARGHQGYSLPLIASESGMMVVDWRSLIKAIVRDLQDGMEPASIGRLFHQSLAQLLVNIAETFKISQVVLSGGVFQNALLLCEARKQLERAGYTVFTHQCLPPHDGGLSVGQAVVAVTQLRLYDKHRRSLSRGHEHVSGDSRTNTIH